MAIAFEIRVGYLRTEFFAHTFIFGAFAHSARTVPAFRLQPFGNGFNDLFILVESYSHKINLSITSATAPLPQSTAVT